MRDPWTHETPQATEGADKKDLNNTDWSNRELSSH